MHSDLLLVIVIVAAVAFDFTNGFHDTANVVASAISTRALSPRAAVALASVLNFAGAFISLKVAATVATGIVDPGQVTETVAFAALIGAIAWNLTTWSYGLPSSSSHALIGGVIGLALVAHGDFSARHFHVPAWVVIVAATAIALGTYAGGWRIIRTVGTRIINMDAAQGFSAQGAGAAVILASSHLGYPLSSTHVISGGVMGAGAAKRLSAVRWGVAGNIVVAWLLTLPAAGVFGAAAYGIANAFGHGALGPLMVTLLSLGLLGRAVAGRRGRLAEAARA